MDRDEAINKMSISLFDNERWIIEQVARRYGFNFSQTIRFIVNEWARENLQTTEAEPIPMDHAIDTG